MTARVLPLFAFLAAFFGAASAQSPAAEWSPPAPQVRAAMAKLEWLKGEWRGEGWRIMPEGREEFASHERVEPQVAGLVLLLHGRGWTKLEDGSLDEEAGHVALGVLSYDAYRRTYVFDSYVQEGYQTRGTPEVGDREFRWSHPAGPGVEMRYHARLTDDGHWFETGERCIENNCTPFFEMKLEKIDRE